MIPEMEGVGHRIGFENIDDVCLFDRSDSGNCAEPIANADDASVYFRCVSAVCLVEVC